MLAFRRIQFRPFMLRKNECRRASTEDGSRRESSSRFAPAASFSRSRTAADSGLIHHGGIARAVVRDRSLIHDAARSRQARDGIDAGVTRSADAERGDPDRILGIRGTGGHDRVEEARPALAERALAQSRSIRVSSWLLVGFVGVAALVLALGWL